MQRIWTASLILFALCVLFPIRPMSAEEEAEEGHEVKLGDGKVTLTVTADWEETEPKFKRIVSAEFAVKPADGDQAAGRVTLGGLGGGVDANLSRWISQYTDAETERETEDVAGQEVTTVSVRGTYKGSRFRKEPSGPGYRLLGAIVQTKDAGTYYVKFYGPEKTVDENEEAFHEMLKSLKVTTEKPDVDRYEINQLDSRNWQLWQMPQPQGFPLADLASPQLQLSRPPAMAHSASMATPVPYRGQRQSQALPSGSRRSRWAGRRPRRLRDLFGR